MTKKKEWLKAPMWLCLGFFFFFFGRGGLSLEPGNGVNGLLIGLLVKTHGSFTESDVFCQISNESENTVRSYTEVTEIRTHDEAREQEKLQNLSWALSSFMWCSIAQKWEKTEGAKPQCLRTENEFSLAWKQRHFKKNILISVRIIFFFTFFKYVSFVLRIMLYLNK